MEGTSAILHKKKLKKLKPTFFSPPKELRLPGKPALKSEQMNKSGVTTSIMSAGVEAVELRAGNKHLSGNYDEMVEDECK